MAEIRARHQEGSLKALASPSLGILYQLDAAIRLLEKTHLPQRSIKLEKSIRSHADPYFRHPNKTKHILRTEAWSCR